MCDESVEGRRHISSDTEALARRLLGYLTLIQNCEESEDLYKVITDTFQQN